MEIERIDIITPPPVVNEVEKAPENLNNTEQPVEDSEDSERVVDLFA